MQNLSFLLLGPLGEEKGKNSIPRSVLVDPNNHITYLDSAIDVRPFIAKSYCVILPSLYREGIPRVLLEAMSMAKPIIATNVSGCKECFKPPFTQKDDFILAQNGILIPPKNVDALESAIYFLLNLPKQDYQKMAQASRDYAIERFEINHVLQIYKDALKKIFLPPVTPTKLAFICNSSFGMYNFRLPVLLMFQKMGYQILIIAPPDTFSIHFEKLGFIFEPIKIASRSLNPIKDIKTYINLKKILKKQQPNLVFNYTIKPIIYGSLASKKIPSIAITTGLGYSFTQTNFFKKWLKFLVCFLYKFSLKRASSVWFLNPDDQNEFLKYQLIPKEKCFILDGEGVDSNYFSPHPFHSNDRNFLLIARVLKEKGIMEYIDVANRFLSRRTSK